MSDTIELEYNCLRVLVVEDDVPTQDMLEYDLKKRFPGVVISAARTVNDAMEMLEKSLNEQQPFDAAIVDFKLPRVHPGDAPEINTDVPDRLISESPSTILIHITGHAEDPRVRQFIEKSDMYLENGRLFIPKDDDWKTLLCDKLECSIHTRRIRRKLSAIFGGSGSNSSRNRLVWSPSGWHSDRERSLAIADLCDDGQRHWTLLTDSLRKDLEGVLGSGKDDQGRICLGVLDSRGEGTMEKSR